MYEWFITDSFHTKTKIGLFHIIRARCVTEDYDVAEKFMIDETTLTCTALQHWMNALCQKDCMATETPLTLLKKSFTFFSAVQPKFNTTARKQKLYYELDVLSLSNSAGSEQNENNVESEVKRINALDVSRSEKLTMLEKLGPEYVKLYRKVSV
jgi:hypothetical protein